jgi:8-oxo-dGTP pyrophosphatase MutT (NUDIX family)
VTEQGGEAMRAESPGDAAAAAGYAEGPPTGDPSVVVRAAGGVVWRRGAGGRVEVILVHRPRYDDWSLPKGKVDPGETEEQAALREVEEESAVVGRMGPELAGTTYIDRSGRTKTVRYWAMTADTVAEASNEVDEVVWLPLAEARDKLSYERDLPVLDSLLAAIGEAPSDVGGE